MRSDHFSFCQPTPPRLLGSGGVGATSSPAAAAVTGRFRGEPFDGVVALAMPSRRGPDQRMIWVFQRTMTCAEVVAFREARTWAESPVVTANVTWVDGFSASPPDATFNTDLFATDGSVELTLDPRPTLRLELSGQDAEANHVSGEIPVQDCPDPG